MMRAVLAIGLMLEAGTMAMAQYPYGYGTTGYPYLNNWQYQRQLAFENQMRWQQMQQQQRALRPQYTPQWMDAVEQSARIRAAKEQAEYYRLLNEQMRQGYPLGPR